MWISHLELNCDRKAFDYQLQVYLPTDIDAYVNNMKYSRAYVGYQPVVL